ncbi:DEAD/DEAH box helicase [Alloscardovia theropitheci]|uniref:DEAD/DEAH box helicase n=1 Tax=Alloscardovia theropitheci TaxID=2496842 RepID=A0A4R0QYP6_9BIFI|nr:DEAD/DEAH box helicase [Alloscardovia theropitheci]TCD54791.1 DEAD/DEAH box helicase [Alloscardovia theropitheci]
MTFEENLSPSQRYAAFRKRRAQEKSIVGIFSESLPFEMDDFQRDACSALSNGHNILVAAPTGAGKTVIADFAIYLAQYENVKAFYTTPIKALSNQKYHELVDLYGNDRVGLLTGDMSITPDADIIVMTTEVLRNMLYERSTTLDALRYVILDEVHYLADRMRGQVWEEVIIHLPQTVKIIGLSATVSNVEDFSAWIRSVRGDTTLVMTEKRPVELLQHVMIQESPRKEPEIFDLYRSPNSEKINPSLIQALNNLDQIARSKSKKLEGKPFGYTKKGRKRVSRQNIGPIRHNTPKRWAVIDELDFLDMLPGIYFIFSRNGCDKAVSQCLQAGLELTTEDEVRQIRHIVNEMIDGQLTPDEMKALHFPQFLASLELGFASHHAGMITLFRHIVEALFEKGLIKVVFATETLALGINMPARTVIVEKLEKYNGVGHVSLTPGEFTQLTGRAGRRGIDTIGHALVVDHNGFEPSAMANLASKRVYPLHSSFAPSFNTAVNLLHTHTLEETHATLDKSFAQWEANASADSLYGMIEDTHRIVSDYERAMHCSRGNFAEFMRIRMKISDIEKRDRRVLKTRVFTSDKARKKAFAELDKRLSALRSKEHNHPCKACPDFAEHIRWGHRWARQTRELERLENRFASRTQSVSRHFDRICDVLEHMGYITRDDDFAYTGYLTSKPYQYDASAYSNQHKAQGEKRTELVLTEKGEVLRHIYSENDILLAQCIMDGIFDNLTAEECAAVMSAFIYESRHDSPSEPAHLPGGAKGTIANAISSIKSHDIRIHLIFESFDLDTPSTIDYGLVEIMFNWVTDKPLTEILRSSDLTAGDFVRACKRETDVLRQIANIAQLRGNTQLKDIVLQASDLVNHGIVALNPLD